MLNNEQEIREVLQNTIDEIDFGITGFSIEKLAAELAAIKPRAKELGWEQCHDFQDRRWKCRVGDAEYLIIEDDGFYDCSFWYKSKYLVSYVTGSNEIQEFDEAKEACREHAEQLAWKLLGVEA